MRNLSRILTLAALAAWLLASPAPAQWTNDPYNGMVTVCDAPGNQTGNLIGRLGGRGWTLVTWMDYRVTDQPRSYYQVLDQTGVPQLEPNGRPVIGDPYWYVGLAYLVPDGEGGLIGVFRDARDGYEDIYGQRFDSLGNRLWGPTGLPLVLWPGNTSTMLKDVEPDAAGGAFVGYGIYSGSETDIYLQKIDNSGQMLWGPTGVPIRLGPTDSAEDRIVQDGAGGALDLWEEYSGYTSHMYGQHFDAEGNPLWGAGGIPILDLFGQQIAMGSFSDGASDGQGGGIWAYVTPGSPNYLKLIGVNGQGQTLWIWSSPYYGSHSFMDFLKHPEDGTIWITVGDNRTGASQPYLYHFNLNGHPLSNPAGVISGNLMSPVSRGVITFKTFWSGGRSRVIAKRFNDSGAQIWESTVALSREVPGGGPGLYSGPAVSDGNDGSVVTFLDLRLQPFDPGNIAAQRVRRNGQLGNPIFLPSVAAVQPPSLKMRPDGQVQFVLPQADQIELELFDLLGRKVATLREGFEPAGMQTIAFDNMNLPSGPYLLRLQAPAGSQVIKVLIMH